jgi:excisionase family DNA binding protein
MTALLTVRKVADLLSVSSETVLRWTRRGDLPAIRLPGGALRYRETEIEAWLTAHGTGAPVRCPEWSTRRPRPRLGP